jgi:hypothetical protein
VPLNEGLSYVCYRGKPSELLKEIRANAASRTVVAFDKTKKQHLFRFCLQ